MNKEIRAFSFEVRAEENDEHGHFLTGVPIVYDQRTDLGFFDEIIDDGALADTDLRDVRFLVNHNTDMIPLARSRNNNSNSTMQMTVVEGKGMEIRVDLDTENNADAKSLYSAVARGRDTSGVSRRFLRCPRSRSRHIRRLRSRQGDFPMRWRARRNRWRAREPDWQRSRDANKK